MKKDTLVGLVVLTATSLLGAAADPKETVLSAVRQLEAQPNYSWRTTVVVPEDAQFKPGPTDGKAEKDGIASFSMSFFDNNLRAVVKGTISFNGNEFPNERTTTVEIKDVGSTKLDLPEAASKKISG